jgi:hypothetical protein
MEGRETGSAGKKKQVFTLLINTRKTAFPILLLPLTIIKIPAAFLNAKYNENLPDSENIWAFIEGSENQMKYW